MSSTFCRFEDHRRDRDTKQWIPCPLLELRMCPNVDCRYQHRVPRQAACELADECLEVGCDKLHPSSRRKPCNFKENCIRPNCVFSHPVSRVEPCPFGANCYEFAIGAGGCSKGHPRRMNRVCRHGEECHLFECKYLHPAGAAEDCPNGGECNRGGECLLKHPKYTGMMVDSMGEETYC